MTNSSCAGVAMSRSRCRIRRSTAPSMPYANISSPSQGKSFPTCCPATSPCWRSCFRVINRLNERVLFPAPNTGATDARRIRRRSVQAMRELLGHLRRKQPVIVAIDDLQWGDIDSISLLGEIFAASDSPPVLVLCTYRREYREAQPVPGRALRAAKDKPGHPLV